MNTILTIIAAIIIFAVLIFVHEFGHFISAKLSGIRVHEFAIGMGPKLFSFNKGETKYSLRLLPIGGYCALEGEDSQSDDPRAFSNKSPLKRLIVLASGAFMNILLGFVLLNIITATFPQIRTTKITQIEAGSPAAVAGLMPGDVITKIDSNKTPTNKVLWWELSDLDGTERKFTINRDGEKMTFNIAPKLKENKYLFGISLEDTAKNNVFLTIREAFHDTFFYSRVVVETLFDLIRGRMGIDQMSGPIGIVSQIGGAVETATETGYVGIMNLLLLAVLLTVNLGVFNLLPLPALDGGRILFVLIEIIRRKPLPPEKEGLVHTIGLIALLLFSLFVAYMDVLKFF